MKKSKIDRVAIHTEMTIVMEGLDRDGNIVASQAIARLQGMRQVARLVLDGFVGDVDRLIEHNLKELWFKDNVFRGVALELASIWRQWGGGSVK